ncbi:MAG TPA: phosphate ABC transporter substrate-binding protein [Candidatus Eisenbergiella intestinipullorum]|nr:phosphate ABC transporter substrate-binding protein [Candidatus Eisenbergiella intestinipullorum]
MKKKFVAIAATAALVMAALAGCGSTATTAESSAPAESTASEAASSEAASTEAASAEASSEAASTEAASTEASTEAASADAALAEIPADLSGTVSMSGSTSMEKFANALAESFMAAYPGVTVTAEFTGSGAGIEAVTAGSVDIGNASRNLTDEEKAAGIAENIVAIDGIAVVVDTANEVAGLTSDQLASIYKGEVTNWSEVGGADQPIVVVGREAGSGTRSAFEELLAIEDQCAYANELDSTGAVMAKVASTPGAIGYVSLDVLDDTVKTISVDDVEPTVENIKSGNYSLSRPFVMATKGEISEQTEAVQAIFTYLASDEGKALIESVGLITVD